jgi:hypothetical protein
MLSEELPEGVLDSIGIAVVRTHRRIDRNVVDIELLGSFFI